MRKRVLLTEDISQEEPLGYIVFFSKNLDCDYKIFKDLKDAEKFAIVERHKAHLNTAEVPIYPLWAGNPFPRNN